MSMASVDGVVRPLDEVTVPVDDRGFLLGDAVYETLRTYRGRLYALAEHLQRLRNSLDAVRLVDAPSLDDIGRWLTATTAAAYASRAAADEGDELVVRVMVTRGRGGHGMSARGAGPPRTYVVARPLPAAPARVYEEGLRVITARTRRVAPAAQDPRIKAASALNLVLARLEADAVDADEALLCDGRGNYLEATSANLVVLRGGVFHAARGEDGVLEGVTMVRVARMLEAAGVEARWGPVDPAVLRAADEVLLTQTTREVLPVVAIDGVAVGSGVPGPWARRLRAEFGAEVARWLGGS